MLGGLNAHIAGIVRVLDDQALRHWFEIGNV
jgi:hypothetical protein